MNTHSKACPYCGETIKAVAIKCRYCGEFLTAPCDEAGASAPGPATVAAQLPIAIDVTDMLASLVDKSLVVYEESTGRYHLLETVRQYAEDRLPESGGAKAVRQLHLDYFLEFVKQAGSGTFGSDQALWLERLNTELENIRVAMEWGLEAEPAASIRMASSLGRFWSVRGYLSEGRRILEYALEQDQNTPPAVRAEGLKWAGTLAGLQEEYEQAKVLLEAGLVLQRELGHKHGIAHSLNNLGLILRAQGDYATARTLHEQALALWQEIGGEWKGGQALSLIYLGMAARVQGDYQGARLALEESLALSREGNLDYDLGWALHELGVLALTQGEHAAAHTYIAESLMVRKRLGDRGGIVEGLARLAHLYCGEKQFLRAVTLLGAVNTSWEAWEVRWPTEERANYHRNLTTARANLSEDAFTEALAQGRAMTFEQAIQYALSDAALSC